MNIDARKIRIYRALANVAMMRIKKATPGPWEASEMDSDGWHLSGNGWDSFAFVYSNEDSELEAQGNANKMLICSAPSFLKKLSQAVIEMAEELEQIVNIVDADAVASAEQETWDLLDHSKCAGLNASGKKSKDKSKTKNNKKKKDKKYKKDKKKR